jgi:hypothetical protein
MIEEETS